MSLHELARLFADPPVEPRSELRWWLAEGRLQTDATVRSDETTKRGMSVRFTPGTNWSSANLPAISQTIRPLPRNSTYEARIWRADHAHGRAAAHRSLGFRARVSDS